jgi:hypothetical protein
MPTPSTPGPSLSRAETPRWGDEFRNAYIQAKRHFKPGVISYVAVAERVSQLIPTSDTTILRLSYNDTVPASASTRQIAYLALVAMGFDPTQFGLTLQDRALKGLTDIQIRKMLDPGHIEKP